MTGSVDCSSLRDVRPGEWERGATYYITSDGSARAWIFRGLEGHTLVLLPDTRQVDEFSTNLAGIFGKTPYVLSELPLDVQSMQNKALSVFRGEEFRKWLDSGGILAATPGALLAPLLFGGGELELSGKMASGRTTLLNWLEERGFERVDLVWAPGQYAPRGAIVDLFDPGYAMPLRFEFFDEAIESIRSFHPDSQKSVATLESVVIHGLDAERQVQVASILPQECRVVLFEAGMIENQAERYRWLWEDIRDPGRMPSLPDWNSVLIRLAELPRVRVTQKVEIAEIGRASCRERV